MATCPECDAEIEVDEYDVDLGCSFMILTADIDKKFDDAERVWRSMLKNFPRQKLETPILLKAPDYQHLTVVRLRTQGEAEDFVRELSGG